MLHALCFRPLLLLVFVKNSLEDLLSLFLTIIKAVVVCADDDYAEVDGEVADVDVQDELFRDAGDTDGSPCFSAVFHAWIGVNIVHQYLNVSWLHLSNLFRVRKYRYRVHGTD